VRGTLGGRIAVILAVLAVLTLAIASRADAFVYWTELTREGDIGRANLDGNPGSVTPEFIEAGEFSEPCGSPAVDNAHIYWADGNFSENAGLIGRANLDGTGVDPDFIRLTGDSRPCGVAVTGTHFYWGNQVPSAETDTIGRASLDGSGVNQAFIGGARRPSGVAVGGGRIYWSNFDGGSIGRANLSGTGVNQNFVFGSTLNAGGVAVDTAHLYWANEVTFPVHSIGRANLDQSAATNNFIPTPDQPAGVAVDNAHVYWGNPDAIGRANLNGTGVDQSFIAGAGPAGVAVDALLPSSDFAFGKAKRNKKKGTAKLAVEQLDPPGLVEVVKTKKVKAAETRANGTGTVTLPIMPARKSKQKLNDRGKAKVKTEVTYTPDGGAPNTQSKSLKLVKR
jgi:virginiamycin B lyase